MTHSSKLTRVKCSYKTDNARFLLDCDFSQQYNSYYKTRLSKTKDQIVENCKTRWPDSNYPIVGLSKLAELCVEYDDADALSDDLRSVSFNESQESLVQQQKGKSEKSAINESNDDNWGEDEFDDDDFENLFAASDVNYRYSEKRRRTLSNEGVQDETNQFDTDTLSRSKSSVIIGKKQSSDDKNSPKTSKRGEKFPITSTQVTCPDSTSDLNKQAELLPHKIHSNKRCIIIGTIFKRMKLQPSVLTELNSEFLDIKVEKYHGNYTSPDDKLVLEDSEQSISLTGNINPKRFVTGVVVGLLGRPIKEGSEFLVVDICYAEPSDQLASTRQAFLTLSQSQSQSQGEVSKHQSNSPDNIILKSPSFDEPIYILILSGLNFNHLMSKKNVQVKALQKLIDFVWGGARYANDERSPNIARVLIVGNSLSEKRFVSSEEQQQQLGLEDISTEMKKIRQLDESSNTINATKHMDNFIAELSKTIDVDLMPGFSDPTTHLLPQQPFHPCMLPKSSAYRSFKSTTNPHHAFYGSSNVEIFATSGQNLDTISRFSEIKDPIEIMKCHLKWGNCAPSAPDNLYSVPYDDQDPFVIDFKPDVYISGNQEEFLTDYYTYNANEVNQAEGRAPDNSIISLASTSSSKTNNSNQICDKNLPNSTSCAKKTLLLTIPKFSSSSSCILLNLKTLHADLINFSE